VDVALSRKLDCKRRGNAKRTMKNRQKKRKHAEGNARRGRGEKGEIRTGLEAEEIAPRFSMFQ
jgi:hypothetical protein